MGLREEKAERMLKLVAAYDRSVESQEVYCDRIGLGLACFRYWLRKRQQLGASGFVRVRAASAEALGEVEIVYPNGVRVSLGSGVDAATLADYIRLW